MFTILQASHFGAHSTSIPTNTCIAIIHETFTLFINLSIMMTFLACKIKLKMIIFWVKSGVLLSQMSFLPLVDVLLLQVVIAGLVVEPFNLERMTYILLHFLQVSQDFKKYKEPLDS